MEKDLVIGLDSSTQSTKAIAWTRSGEAVAEGRAPIDSDIPQAGHVEQDVEQWWTSCCSALRELCNQLDANRFAAMAISDQRETVGFLDRDGRAVRPAMVWLDERARDEVQPFAEAIGPERLHAITGKPIDLTPVVYRLCWLRRHEPDKLDAAAKIVDVHGFLAGRLTGRYGASHTSADPFGIVDIAAKTYAKPILEALRLSDDKFADLLPPGALIGGISASASAATGLSEGLPLIAAGGDGQCAGLGVDATRPGRIYLNLGTAIITGAWSKGPAIGRYWRTMTSPTGEGYFLEGVQRAGAFFVNWFIDNFAGGRDDPAVFSRLEQAASELPIGADGVLVCPYLSGVMDPHWDPAARATFTGLATHHTTAHLYRASLEALTLESARCIEAMRENGIATNEILAVGGGANSKLWLKMLADSTGLPATRSLSLEASALGAGITAAVGVGWFEDFDAAAAAMTATGETTVPDPVVKDAWQTLSAAQSVVYQKNKAN